MNALIGSRPDAEIVRVWMADAMRTDALHNAAIKAEVLRPIAHDVIRLVVNRADLARAFVRRMDDEITEVLSSVSTPWHLLSQWPGLVFSLICSGGHSF